MLVNENLQETIEEIKSISGVDVGVVNNAGNVLATTKDWGEISDMIESFINKSDEVTMIGKVTLLKVLDNEEILSVVLVEGKDALIVGKMTTLQIRSLLNSNEEETERENFIKNLLLDNLLIVDIANNAKGLNINPSAKRCVYVIEVRQEDENLAAETLKNIYVDRDKDFITSIGEHTIILIKEIEEDDSEADVANTILDMLNSEAMVKARVAYGTTINEMREVSRAYKEATMALDVGSVFSKDEHIVAYDNLGIGRLIYQLPLPLCEMYIKEVFKGSNPKELDEETLATVDKFFENNLNVSEAARQLYIHRNTLVYRLDKIQHNTGLDLRVLDDAITFKIGMMIIRYMDYIENNKL